jgi:hypothetical protein
MLLREIDIDWSLKICEEGTVGILPFKKKSNESQITSVTGCWGKFAIANWTAVQPD